MRSSRIASLLLLAFAASFAAAEPVELVGQIVCSNCWFEADRNEVAYGTPADLDCWARCDGQGIPPAFAVRDEEGEFELFTVEGDHDWSGLVSRYARIEGSVEEGEDRPVLRAESVAVLQESPWPVAAAGGHDEDHHDLSWTDLGGHELGLDDFHGRIVVLNFWATWCAPCRKEMPDLVRIQNRYGMHGVQVVGAAADPAMAKEPVVEMARKLKVNFPVLLGATTEQMEALGVGTVLPATVVLDRHGHPVERIMGVFEREELEATLDRMIAGDGGVAVAAASKGHTHSHGAGTQASLVPS